MEQNNSAGKLYTAVVHSWRDYKGDITFAAVRDLLGGFPPEATRILYIPIILQIDTSRGLELEDYVEAVVLTENKIINQKPGTLADVLGRFSSSSGHEPRVVVVDIGYRALRRHMGSRYGEVVHLQRKIVKPPKPPKDARPQSEYTYRFQIKPQP